MLNNRYWERVFKFTHPENSTKKKRKKRKKPLQDSFSFSKYFLLKLSKRWFLSFKKVPITLFKKSFIYKHEHVFSQVNAGSCLRFYCNGISDNSVASPVTWLINIYIKWQSAYESIYCLKYRSIESGQK